MKILVRIYKEARRYWGYILFATLSLFLVTASNLVAPKLMQGMIAILEREGANEGAIGEITRIALLLLCVYAVQLVTRYLNNYYSHVAAWHFVSDIRVKVYNHLQKLSLSYFHDKQTGQLMSRVVNDTNAFEMLIAHSIPQLAGAIIMFIGVTAILFSTNATLALMTCIPIPFIFIGVPIMKRIRSEHKKAQVYIAELNGALQDNLSGIKEIQIFNKQQAELEKVEKHSLKHISALLKALWYSAMFHPSISFLTSLGNVIVVGFGGYLALTRGNLEISEIVGFLIYLSMFYEPVSSFARIIEDMQSGIVGGERIFEILDTEPDVAEKPHAKHMPIASGKLTFENVSFSYRGDIPVLENISFEIPAKKMYAIVGATGVGKTTLTALLPRFYDPIKGRILLDGIDIRDITLASLRDNISMVLQDVFLFNGTIRDNITYGSHSATDEEVENAARVACIHDFIQSLPDGFDTIVDERGVRLSGGQKQRISIARSILSHSSVLVMDEATSAVDTETETEIRKAIAGLSGSRTMLVIAHRLSTVKSADCIIVLNEGKIAETGTHDELVAKNGIYKRLVDKQNIIT